MTRKSAGAKPAKAKARLRTLDDLDRRTRAYQDTTDLQDRIAGDLGGWDRLSAMQRELITAASLMGAMIRDRAASYLSGEPVDLAEFITLSNAQRRHLADLGLERRMGNVTPALSKYISEGAAA